MEKEVLKGLELARERAMIHREKSYVPFPKCRLRTIHGYIYREMITRILIFSSLSPFPVISSFSLFFLSLGAARRFGA